jgi:hypothetical protein
MDKFEICCRIKIFILSRTLGFLGFSCPEASPFAAVYGWNGIFWSKNKKGGSKSRAAFAEGTYLERFADRLFCLLGTNVNNMHRLVTADQLEVNQQPQVNQGQ